MLLNNIAFHWLLSGFTLLTPLDFSRQSNVLREKKYEKCIRTGITVLKIVI